MTSEERLQQNALRFHFTGQPVEEWPHWMIFMNYAYNGRDTIILHLWEGRTTVRIGDTVTRYTHGVVEISANKILRFPERSPTLVDVGAVAAA
jgi:hypothetical protein